MAGTYPPTPKNNVVSLFKKSPTESPATARSPKTGGQVLMQALAKHQKGLPSLVAWHDTKTAAPNSAVWAQQLRQTTTRRFNHNSTD